jgi:hypothetical protein
MSRRSIQTEKNTHNYEPNRFGFGDARLRAMDHISRDPIAAKEVAVSVCSLKGEAAGHNPACFLFHR